MRWLWRHPADEDDGGAEARAKAEAEIARVNGRWPEVREVAGSLRKLRDENHFAEQIIGIFSAGRQK